MNLADLFKPPPPQPVKKPLGLYECRRCKQRFEYPDFSPCRANSGYSKLGGYYFWDTIRHDCSSDRPERRVYGLADLVGATVTTELPNA